MKLKTMLLAVAALASGTMFAFDDDTIGFYSFSEGAAGESALGTSANDVAGSAINAVTIKRSGDDQTATATYTDQRPGKYVYGSASATEPIAIDPKSVHIVGGSPFAEHKGSELSFANAGRVLSQHHATGFTIEFFMLMQPDDPWFKSSNMVYLPVGYKDLADSKCKSMLMRIPSSADFEIHVAYSSMESSVYSSKKAFYPNTLRSGKWRHFAFVEMPNGNSFKFKVYVDRVLRYDYAFKSSEVVATTLSSGGDFRLGAGSLTATIACVRFTKRALTADGFMVASDKAPAFAGEGAVGFYSFADAAPGTSAVGVQIGNAVRPAGMFGSVALNDNATINPYATFDADAPGRLILDGEAGTVVCTNAQSLKVGSDAVDGLGGRLTIDDVGTELSKCHANGHTIEYFYKLDGTKSSNYEASLGVNAGYLNLGASTTSELRLYAPYANGNARRNGCCLGYYGENDSNKCRVDATVALAPNDGRWHHVALVETSDHRVEYYYDYDCYGSFALGGTTSVSAGNPFSFFRDHLQGKISCVRFTDHQLAPAQFLCAIDRIPEPVRQPDVVAFYDFKDGEKGTSAVGTRLVDSVHPSRVAGGTTLAANANATAVFDDDCPAPAVYGGERYPETPFVTNPGSITLDSDVDGTSGTIRFPTMAKTLHKLHGTGFTVELFFKFLDSRMLEWDPNIQICAGYLNNGVEAPFNITLPYNKEGRTYLYGFGYSTSQGQKSHTLAAPLWDDKWHHFAYVETPTVDETASRAKTNCVVTVWVDGQRARDPYVIENIYEQESSMSGDLMHLSLCRDKNHAKFSCLKITARPLDKREFMRTEPRSPGLSIIVR